MTSSITTRGVRAIVTSTDNGIVRWDSTTGRLVQDSGVTIDDSNNVNLGDDVALQFGASQDAQFLWETADADAHYLNLFLGASRNFIISEDGAIDWGHAAQTNPTLWIHSADSTDLNDYISIAHDQTDAQINTGTGGINFSQS